MRTLRVITTGLAVATLLALAACSRVKDDWKAAQAADTTEAYQQFLKAHADSEFGTSAQDRLKQLAEDRDWQQTATLDTRDAYEQFVAQHADGKWAQEARVRIENFKTATTDESSAAAPANAGLIPGESAKAVTPAKSAAPAKPGASVYAQLGAFSSSARAESEWQRLRGKSPKILGALKPRYVPAKVDGKTLYRLQVAQPSRDAAEALCGSLKKQSVACMVPAS